MFLQMLVGGGRRKADADDEDDDDMLEEDGDGEEEDMYDAEERQFYDSVPENQRIIIDAKEKEIEDLVSSQRLVPLRFRILNSGMPSANMQAVLDRVYESGDKDKSTQFINNLLRIPFGKFARLPVGPESSKADVGVFLRDARNKLDTSVYGMESAKSLFMMTLAKWASNPTSRGLVLGLKGPMGVGKTTLVKEGLGQALGIPSVFVALGSANDSSYLDGHSYTYEGAVCGMVAEALMTAGVMNPIICFDELDKVAENTRGAEIYNTLIHLTDPTQNSSFCDKYFGTNVSLDLSRSIIVFTYNDSKHINPILLNRMIEIAIPDYSTEEKRVIARDFVLPKAMQEFGPGFGVEFGQDAIDFLIDKSQSVAGMRAVQHDVAKILGAHNLELLLTTTTSVLSEDGPSSDQVIIDKARAERLLKVTKTDGSDRFPALPDGVRHMYS